MDFVNRNDIKMGTQLVVLKPSKGIKGEETDPVKILENQDFKVFREIGGLPPMEVTELDERVKGEIRMLLKDVLYSDYELLVTYGKGGLKDEPLLLTVDSFSKRDFMAIDRYGIPHYFSQKTGKCSGQEDIAQVATEAEVAEIRAIQDYNRQVTAIRQILEKPGEPWDAVIELFCKQPTTIRPSYPVS